MSDQNVPAQWRKIPTVVAAAKWDGSFTDFRDLQEWAGESITYHDDATGIYLLVATLEGNMRLPQGWWLIEGVEGEFYPCKPSVFAATYEEAALAEEAPVDDGPGEYPVAEVELVSGEPLLHYVLAPMGCAMVALGIAIAALVIALVD
jgi:hypothetical protein